MRLHERNFDITADITVFSHGFVSFISIIIIKMNNFSYIAMVYRSSVSDSLAPIGENVALSSTQGQTRSKV